jgi:hypothetical protein
LSSAARSVRNARRLRRDERAGLVGNLRLRRAERRDISGDLVSAAADASAGIQSNRHGGGRHARSKASRARRSHRRSTSSLFGGRGALVSLSGEPTACSAPRFMVVELGETGATRAAVRARHCGPRSKRRSATPANIPTAIAAAKAARCSTKSTRRRLQPFARGPRHVPRPHRERRRYSPRDPLSARQSELRFAIHGGAEAWQVADELARARIPVILDPLVNLPDRALSVCRRVSTTRRCSTRQA